MKKLAFAVLMTAAAFALSQCALFNTTVEYSVTSTGFPSVTILYNDENGEGVEINTTAPWSVSFDLFTSDRPFVAAIRVSNNDLTENATAFIYEDGVVVASDTALPWPDIAEAFAWIE
jgi:hypothetical protein